MSRGWLWRTLLGESQPGHPHGSEEVEYYTILFNIAPEVHSKVLSLPPLLGKNKSKGNSYCDNSIMYFNYNDDGQELEVTMEPLQDDLDCPVEPIPESTCTICDSKSQSPKSKGTIGTWPTAHQFPSARSVRVFQRDNAEYATIEPPITFIKYLPILDERESESENNLIRLLNKELELFQKFNVANKSDDCAIVTRSKSEQIIPSEEARLARDTAVVVKGISDTLIKCGNISACIPNLKVCKTIPGRFSFTLNDTYVQEVLFGDYRSHSVALYITKSPKLGQLECDIMEDLSTYLLKSFLWPSKNVKITWMKCLHKLLAQMILDSSAEPIFPCQRFEDGYDAAALFSPKASLYVRHTGTAFIFNLSQILKTFPHRVLMLRENQHRPISSLQ